MSAKDDFELVGNAVGLAGYRAKTDKYAKAYERLFTPRPIEEWHEDMGMCLWYEFPICEPPYVGSPLDTDWPEYHTHFTPLIPILTPDDMRVK